MALLMAARVTLKWNLFLSTGMINDVCRNAEGENLHNLATYKFNNAFNRIQTGQTHLASSCVHLLVDALLVHSSYSMVSSRMFWNLSRSVSTMRRTLPCLTWGWQDIWQGVATVKHSDHPSPHLFLLWFNHFNINWMLWTIVCAIPIALHSS